MSLVIEALGEGDLGECVRVQRRVWGFEAADLVTSGALASSGRRGGILYGAHDSASGLVGFVFSFPALLGRRPVQHSHMLAVLEEYRGRGIGFRLKEAQYREARRRGIGLITWTFDPLEARNAHLNCNKLGVVVRRYYVNLYGERTSSHLHTLGTDRFLAEWSVASGWPAEAQPEPERLPALARLIETRLERGLLKISSWDETRAEAELALEIPGDIQRLAARDLETARQWRQVTRRLFCHYLERGYEIRGLWRCAGDGEEAPWRVFYRLCRGEGS